MFWGDNLLSVWCVVLNRCLCSKQVCVLGPCCGRVPCGATGKSDVYIRWFNNIAIAHIPQNIDVPIISYGHEP